MMVKIIGNVRYSKEKSRNLFMGEVKCGCG